MSNPSRLYVGNLNYSVTQEDLSNAFSPYGKVTSVSIVTDKMTGRPRGFAFVEMESTQAAEAAAQALNGKEFMSRELVVNPARPQEPRGDRPRSGGFGGGPRRSY